MLAKIHVLFTEDDIIDTDHVEPADWPKTKSLHDTTDGGSVLVESGNVVCDFSCGTFRPLVETPPCYPSANPPLNAVAPLHS